MSAHRDSEKSSQEFKSEVVDVPDNVNVFNNVNAK